MQEKLKRFGLSIFSGILLGIAWPTGPWFPLIFVGFVPLLMLERMITQNGVRIWRKVLLHSFIAILIWNAITTWWVWNSTAEGSIAAMILNSFLLCLPFLAFHFTRRLMGDKLGYISLPVYWIAFEYLHLNWEFSWPWLTLGNVFASAPSLVQWYEYTGALGGSLWVLVVNLTVMFCIYKRFKLKQLALLGSLFLLPLLISWVLPVEKPEGLKEYEVMVVQPNINAYTQKFMFNPGTGTNNKKTFIPFRKQDQRLVDLTIKNVSDKTAMVLWPETSLHQETIPFPYWERSLDSLNVLKQLKGYSAQRKTAFLIGATTRKRYPSKDKAPPTANNSKRFGYYDNLNSGLFLDDEQKIQVYHKSKLVPGVERMPYPGMFSFLELFAIDLGGITGSLGIQKERMAFQSKHHELSVAPVICYESVFGGFTADYFEKGADFIGIITNDGWWGNTAGHEHHFEYARLRAIENRSWVARSANTGISGFIAPDGSVKSTLGWDKMGVLKQNITPRWKNTFYTKYGDYLGRLFAFVTVLLVLSMVVKGFKR